MSYSIIFKSFPEPKRNFNWVFYLFLRKIIQKMEIDIDWFSKLISSGIKFIIEETQYKGKSFIYSKYQHSWFNSKLI